MNSSDPLTQRNRDALMLVNAAISDDPTYKAVPEDARKPALRRLPMVLGSKIYDGTRDWSIEIGLTSDFPDEPPVVFIAGAEQLYLQSPHVFEDGQLCIFPEYSALDHRDPAGLIRYARSQARAILKGTAAQDFRIEFSSYWARRVTKDALEVLILDPIERLEKTFPVAFLKGVTCVAGSSESLAGWAANRLGTATELTADKRGVRLDVEQPLIPHQYPETLQDLIDLAQKNDQPAYEVIIDHVFTSRGIALVLLAQREQDGLALGGIQFSGLHLKARTISGFRRGKAPRDVVIKRSMGDLRSSKVSRSKVKRVDSLWIHSRGGDGRDLSGKSILLIGCGSLGGYVAHLLSRAGVGRLIMTDNDELEWNNLGRHILGANSVGRGKAEALAASIAAELPHLHVRGIALDWRDAYRKEPSLFTGQDLVISTVADWRCEAPLNMMGRTAVGSPIAFGWLEPHAVAGHCLIVGRAGGCFACGADRFGRFAGSVAEHEGMTVKREPGGCTHYQSYGPTALMPVASMIATSAIDAILNRTSNSSWYTWVSNREHFDASGARLSARWFKRITDEGFSRTYSSSWDRQKSCALCQATNC